ncbi:hypothetical protein SK128_007914 [Halocaridina rubra]|uniref:Uncharacterized protein n=1 Tax=Halocaridina rubra TaxID=373956 RepID=A0AAN8XE45_HALRR
MTSSIILVGLFWTYNANDVPFKVRGPNTSNTFREWRMARLLILMLLVTPGLPQQATQRDGGHGGHGGGGYGGGGGGGGHGHGGGGYGGGHGGGYGGGGGGGDHKGGGYGDDHKGGGGGGYGDDHKGGGGYGHGGGGGGGHKGYHPSPCHPQTITKYRTVYKDRKAEVANNVEVRNPKPQVKKIVETRYTTIRYPVFITQVIKPLLTQVETKVRPMFFTKTINRYTTVKFTVTGIGQVTVTTVKYEKEYITRCNKKGYGGGHHRREGPDVRVSDIDPDAPGVPTYKTRDPIPRDPRPSSYEDPLSPLERPLRSPVGDSIEASSVLGFDPRRPSQESPRRPVRRYRPGPPIVFGPEPYPNPFDPVRPRGPLLAGSRPESEEDPSFKPHPALPRPIGLAPILLG